MWNIYFLDMGTDILFFNPQNMNDFQIYTNIITQFILWKGFRRGVGGGVGGGVKLWRQ